MQLIYDHLLEITNLSESETITEQFPNETLSYSELIDILQEISPQISPSQICLMYYSDQDSCYQFITRDFKYIFTHENEILQIQFQQIWKQDYLQNYLRDKQEIKAVLECAQDYWQDVRRVICEPLDVHLFWASPYYTEDNFDRKLLQKYKNISQEKNLKNDGKVVLRASVKYNNCIQSIVKCLRKSRKNVHLSIDNFNFSTFKNNNKKKFSVVYLICHTEVAQEEIDDPEGLMIPVKTEKKYSKNSTGSEKKEMADSNESSQREFPSKTKTNESPLPNYDLAQSLEIRIQQFGQDSRNARQKHENDDSIEIPSEVKKTLTEDVFTGTFLRYQNKTISSYSDRKLKKDHNKSVRHNKKSSHFKRNKVTRKYFVGEDPSGKMVHITPEKLQEMLSSKHIEIELLILHTSYPFFHTETFLKHAKNIILINSNPILPDESVNFFLQKYFEHLLDYRSIQKAYSKTIAETQAKFPAAQCCCYHEHESNCSSRYNVKTSKFDGYHYMYHIDRCSCPEKAMLKHYCADKMKLAQRDYKILKKDQANQHHFLDEIFFCCCKTEKHLEHSFRRKFFDFKMNGIEKEPLFCEDFEIQPGTVNQFGSWLDSFCKQTLLIGNQQVIIAMLKLFVPENFHSGSKNGFQNQHQDMRIFNIFGIPRIGKRYVSRCFANLLMRKSKQRFVRWEQREFEDVRQIRQLDDDVFYIFKRKAMRGGRRILKIEKIGDNSLPEKICAIIITQERIITELPDIISMESQPFDRQEQCGAYIKCETNFNQQLKNKLKIYLKQTLREGEKYYPRTFQKDQIILSLKRSKYDKESVYKEFLSECRGIPIVDLMLVGGTVNNCKRTTNQLQYEVDKLRLKSKEGRFIEPKNSAMTFDNIKMYYPLVYQRYAEEIAEQCLEIMRIYVLKTEVKDQYLRFFEATTINPKSYASIFLRDTLLKVSKTQAPDLGNSFKSTIYETALEFLWNCLMTHIIFSYLSLQDREELVKLGILLINNLIILQKKRSYFQKTPQLCSSVSIQIPGLDFSLSLEEEEETQIVNLESLNLTSRKGLVYLLDRLMFHIPYEVPSKYNLKIIAEELKVQLYFESKYESEKLHETFNQEMEKIIFKIVQRNDKINKKNPILNTILEYDLVLSLTLLYTNCGRQAMTKHAENMIRKARKEGSTISRLMRGTSMGMEPQPEKQNPRSVLFSKMCSDKNLYNRMINGLNSNRDEDGNFQELSLYEDILSKWDILSKCQPNQNPLEAYHILISMQREISQGDKFRWSHYLQCLFRDLQKKIDEKLNKLNKKLFVWMQSNPIPNTKKESILESRTLIKNTVIQKFNKESEKKRRMLAIKIKLNIPNLQKLRDIRGCRFLCLDINLNKNNETQLIGENFASELELIPQKLLVEIIETTPIINLFICLRKPSILVKSLKALKNLKKDMVYFDFNLLQKKLHDSPKTAQAYEKMVMMQVIKSIVDRMHFHRDNITEAFEKAMSSLEFKDQKGNFIMKNSQLQKVTFLHFYEHYYDNAVIDGDAPEPIILRMEDVFDSQQLQKVQQITKVCFPSHGMAFKSRSKSLSQGSETQIQLRGDNRIQLRINFQLKRLIDALTEYLKLKENFHNFILINVENCYKNYGSQDFGLFRHMKNQNILDLYYTAKKGILIFLNTQLIADKGQKWEKEEFDRLFAKPESEDLTSSSADIKSVKARITSTIKNKKSTTDILICFFDRMG